MVNKRNVIYGVLSLGCLVFSYYIHGQANQKVYVNSKFVDEEIQGSYGRRTTIKYNNAAKKGEEELVEKCFQIFDSLQVRSYKNWEGFEGNIRGQLLSISDSLGIEISAYQSNISVWNSVIESLITCHDVTLKRGLRLLIYDYEILESDSVMLAIFPFRDVKDVENIEFIDSGRMLGKEETMSFRGNMLNIEAMHTNPVTLESKVFKYK